MYQSIPSLTIPPGNPGDSHVPTAPGGVGFSPNFLCPGDGSLNERQFGKKMEEFLDSFQRNRRQLEKQVLWWCFISIFTKTVMCTVF